VCDSTCATSAPGVVAAGDIARWPNNLFGETMRVEHWSNAVEQGEAAARRLLAPPGEAVEFAPVPYFWSDQYDTKIQFLGRCCPTDEVRIVDGSID
jgi:3-phenylpropionate/trans-cinnamate dioxygenase ferredoxin reductase component